MLPLIGLAASLAPTVFQGILGANQKNQADKISPGERPIYEVPKAEQEALNVQRLLSSSNAPGYTQAKEDIESASANNLLAAMKMGNPNVSTAFRNKTDALKDLNMSNELYRERQQNNLVNKLSEYAGYQEKEFDINEMQPYQYALDQSMALEDASNQNIYGALGDASSGVLQYLQTVGGDKAPKLGTDQTSGIAKGIQKEAGLSGDLTSMLSKLDLSKIDMEALLKIISSGKSGLASSLTQSVK